MNVCKRSSAKSKSQYIMKNGSNIVVDMGSISNEDKLIGTKRTTLQEDCLTKRDLVMVKDDIGKGKIIGKVVMIPKEGKYICGDHVYRLTVKNVNVIYLYYAINSYAVNKSFRRQANGTAQIGINNKTVDDQIIPYPNITEQKKIASFLAAIDYKIDHVQSHINQTQQFKKGLLQQMFV